MIIKRVTPIARCFALQQRQQRAALDVARHFNTRQLEKSGSIVDVLHHITVHAMLATRHIDEQRRAERLFVHEPLVKPTMLAHVKPLIGRVDDERVV